MCRLTSPSFRSHLASSRNSRRVSLGEGAAPKQNPDLHSHLFYSSLFASPVGWLCGIPAILETPHLRELWREGKGWLKGSFFIDRLIGRCVDGYIAVSKANGSYLRDVKKLPGRKIHVVQNGSDLKRFRPDHPSPAECVRVSDSGRQIR